MGRRKRELDFRMKKPDYLISRRGFVGGVVAIEIDQVMIYVEA
jgi:hypothetical protein